MYGADQELMLASLLYDAGIDENMWPHTLDRLNHVLGCDGVALALCSEDGSISHYQTGTAFRLDARRSRDAAMQRPRVHDLVAAETVCPGPEGTWRPRLDFRCIEFQSVTRDEADVQRAVAANRPPPGTLRCVFVVVRCAHRAPFANEDIALLQSLLPHVRRSLAIQLRHGATSAAESCALACLSRLSYAVFFIGSTGNTLGMNAVAEGLLRDGSGLTLRARQLATARPAQTRALGQLLDRAVRPPREGGWIAIDRADGGAPLRCLVMPAEAPATGLPDARDVTALLVIDGDSAPGGRERALDMLYGLTPAESAVAQRTIRGEGAPTIAAALRVAPATVRTHLQRAFEKTGARGQAELGILVSRLPADVLPRRSARNIGGLGERFA